MVSLCRAEVTDLQYVARGVNEQVRWLNVPMNNAFTVDIGESSQKLITVELNQKGMQGLLELLEALDHSINCHGDKVHYYVQH